MKSFAFALCCLGIGSIISCDSGPRERPEPVTTQGLRIAYVNGDSILHKYSEFRAAAESIDLKQRDAEQKLQAKAQELEKQVTAYQRRAQSGSMSPKEMQQEEQRLGNMQETLRQESDEMSRALMQETAEINDRLQKVVRAKLKEIKDLEGYDFIFNSMDGGPILIADERHNITDRVLKELNGGVNSDSRDSVQ